MARALPFDQLMRLEKLDDYTYLSIERPFAPGENLPEFNGITYGGHVYAQASWAAAQTVAEGFILHNATGFFLISGNQRHSFTYHVKILRDGRSYCTRMVEVTQGDADGASYVCICSFQKPEANVVDVQDSLKIEEEYQSVLVGKSPEDHDLAPTMDVPWYWQWQKDNDQLDVFPGLESRKVDMAAYNEGKDSHDKRQLLYYRPIGNLPSNHNLQLCAHLYASDRNSLFTVANHFGLGDSHSHMGSLVHNVTFHAPIEQMLFSKDPDTAWYCKEGWTTRIAAGRGMFHARLWSRSGVHIATITQEGLIRLPKDAKL